jgi:Ubiquitin carboxyl-terminal hydrolase
MVCLDTSYCTMLGSIFIFVRDCPQCKVKRRASKKLSLARLPPVLMVHFKRFEANGRFSDKIDTFVDFPMKSLDLTNYMPPPLPPGVDRSQLNGGLPLSLEDPRSQLPPYRYDLYGVTNHYGNLSSGHCEFLGSFLSYLMLIFSNLQIPRSLHQEVAGCIAMTAVSNLLIPNKSSCVSFLHMFSLHVFFF